MGTCGGTRQTRVCTCVVHWWWSEFTGAAYVYSLPILVMRLGNREDTGPNCRDGLTENWTIHRLPWGSMLAQTHYQPIHKQEDSECRTISPSFLAQRDCLVWHFSTSLSQSSPLKTQTIHCGPQLTSLPTFKQHHWMLWGLGTVRETLLCHQQATKKHSI